MSHQMSSVHISCLSSVLTAVTGTPHPSLRTPACQQDVKGTWDLGRLDSRPSCPWMTLTESTFVSVIRKMRGLKLDYY